MSRKSTWSLAELSLVERTSGSLSCPRDLREASWLDTTGGREARGEARREEVRDDIVSRPGEQVVNGYNFGVFNQYSLSY